MFHTIILIKRMSMEKIPTANGTTGDTKTALLEVGAVCFARKGYQATSVREICGQAGANIAAVNYHFGGKKDFYKTALLHAFKHASPAGWPPPTLAEAPDDPEGQLKKFIRWFVERMLRDKGNNIVRDLLHHELREPTGALDVLIDTTMKPATLTLIEIIRALCNDRLSDTKLRLVSSSILGQGLIYKQCLPMLERVFGAEQFGPEHIEEIAEHIFRFSLAGIQAAAERPAPGKTQETVV